MSEKFVCLVCDSENPGFTWSDQHGEGMCLVCGTPYQLLHYEGEGENHRRVDKPPSCNIKPEWIPALRACYADLKIMMWQGCFLGVDEHRYPGMTHAKRQVNEWCHAHPELLPQEHPIPAADPQQTEQKEE